MAAQRRRIAGRFAVLGEVGRGAFGVVVRAWDTASQAPVAIKIVRRGGRHHLDAVMEAEKLEILRWRDREHKFCVCVKSVCDYQGHVCLVTELLGITLLSALRDLRVQGSSGVRVETARRVAAQLCEALEFLRRSRLIHADLKTENICLAQPGVTCAPVFLRFLQCSCCYFHRIFGGR
jgi:serine/threonine protein kinase